MGYEAMGAVHAWAARAWTHVRERAEGRPGPRERDDRRFFERGQGTVEYVGLILLVAVILAGVVKATGSFSDKGIADAVVKKLKAAIEGVGK